MINVKTVREKQILKALNFIRSFCQRQWTQQLSAQSAQIIQHFSVFTVGLWAYLDDDEDDKLQFSAFIFAGLNQRSKPELQ